MKNIVLPLTISLSACAPLQQAPLMYTSKQVFGVDVSAPTTESTGVTMNLGYKSVDAAYVPIAVSRKEDSQLTLVSASYGEGDDRELGNKELQAEKLSNYSKAFLDVEQKRIQAEQDKSQLDTATEFNTALDDKTNGNPDSLARFIEKYSPAQESVLYTKISTERPFSATELGKLFQKSSKSEQELAEANEILTQAKNDLEAVLHVSRKDAMSVYGSFNANTSTSPVGNKLGKMFSTGVAAQNLTEGVKLTSTNAIQLLNSCSNAAALIKDEKLRDATLKGCLKGIIAE